MTYDLLVLFDDMQQIKYDIRRQPNIRASMKRTLKQITRNLFND